MAVGLARPRPSALPPCGCSGRACSLRGVLWGRFPCFAVRNECPSTSPVRPQVPMSRGLQDIHRGGELAGCRASAPADRQNVSSRLPEQLQQLRLCQQQKPPWRSRRCRPTPEVRENPVVAEGAGTQTLTGRRHGEAKETGLGRGQPCQHLDCKLLASRTVRR